MTRRSLRFDVSQDTHDSMRLLRAQEDKTNEQLLDEMIPVYNAHLKQQRKKAKTQ